MRGTVIFEQLQHSEYERTTFVDPNVSILAINMRQFRPSPNFVGGTEINKIKKIIHNIKEHNRIWLKFDSIVPDFYDKEPEIKDDAQIQLYYRRLEGYEKILIKEIPIVLQYIKSARDRLSNHQS